ncbi:hypothetical protein HMPREF2739_10690 [Staphylococcus sp. HMSC074F11]|nr:hypothetical protein HMPREF2739_10690 [Staphylococcus sp. HMSC074F11]
MSIITLIVLLLNELEKREMLDSIEANLTLCYFKASFTENNGIVMNKALYYNSKNDAIQFIMQLI